jgi:murein DD-endopeptidase MepM/ murein hydrolase activator NlpD
MSEPRTFKIDTPPMKGEDIKRSQLEVRKEFEGMGIPYPLKADGVYGKASRSAYATLCTAQGILHYKAMADGVTPELRSKLRDRDKLTAAERKRMDGAKAVTYRRKLRESFEGGGVSKPVARITQDSWGFTPRTGSNAGATHDGIDVGTNPKAPLLAMVRSRVVRADNDDWWGKAPSGNVKLGDGIVILECLETVGPFKKGYCIGYGHAEGMRVKPGETVEAGEHIANAGLAVIYHIHLMVNGGKYAKTQGRGDRDPRPLLDYAVKHS